MFEVYPDVDWFPSPFEVMELQTRIRELERMNADCHVRTGNAMAGLGREIVRAGNMEAKLGVAIMDRIVVERTTGVTRENIQRFTNESYSKELCEIQKTKVRT